MDSWLPDRHSLPPSRLLAAADQAAGPASRWVTEHCECRSLPCPALLGALQVPEASSAPQPRWGLRHPYVTHSSLHNLLPPCSKWELWEQSGAKGKTTSTAT